MLLLADVDKGDGLAASVFLLWSLSVGGGFLFRFDTFPEEVVVEGGIW